MSRISNLSHIDWHVLWVSLKKPPHSVSPNVSSKGDTVQIGLYPIKTILFTLQWFLEPVEAPFLCASFFVCFPVSEDERGQLWKAYTFNVLFTQLSHTFTFEWCTIKQTSNYGVCKTTPEHIACTWCVANHALLAYPRTYGVPKFERRRRTNKFKLPASWHDVWPLNQAGCETWCCFGNYIFYRMLAIYKRTPTHVTMQ